MNFFKEIKFALDAWRIYRKIGGTMNAAEVMAAIAAVQEAIPVIENAVVDLERTFVEVKKAVQHIRDQVAAAKTAAGK